MTDQKYGWLCESFDDERLACPFDSVEAALADAKTTIEEEGGPDGNGGGFDPGTHTVKVSVSRVSRVEPFSADRVIDDMIDRLCDDGFEEPDKDLHLVGAARDTLRDALRAAWDAHVEREKVGPLWEATHRGVDYGLVVTIVEPAS